MNHMVCRRFLEGERLRFVSEKEKIYLYGLKLRKYFENSCNLDFENIK